MGPSRPFLKSSQPLTHCCPGGVRVSGEACLLRLFITFSCTPVNTYKNIDRYSNVNHIFRRNSEFERLAEMVASCLDVSLDLFSLLQGAAPGQLTISTNLGFPEDKKKDQIYFLGCLLFFHFHGIVVRS